MEIDLLGTDFMTFSGQRIVNLIEKHIADNATPSKMLLTTLNLRSCELLLKNASFQKAQSAADIAIIDSTIILWFLNALGYEVNHKWRATMLDWMPLLLERSNENKLRIFFLGTTEENISSASSILKDRYPALEISYQNGYLETEEDRQTLFARVSQFKPHILFAGMGMPRQELFLYKHLERLECRVLIPVGGYFDYICGAQYSPPRWSGRMGLEWFFRLASNPKRLYKRYLISSWRPLFNLTSQVIKKRL